MRISPSLEAVIHEAITRCAEVAPDLRDPQVQNVIMALCKESYRAGVAEYQEPIKLEVEGPGDQDWQS
jgi:hypothetical protein